MEIKTEYLEKARKIVDDFRGHKLGYIIENDELLDEVCNMLVSMFTQALQSVAEEKDRELIHWKKSEREANLMVLAEKDKRIGELEKLVKTGGIDWAEDYVTELQSKLTLAQGQIERLIEALQPFDTPSKKWITRQHLDKAKQILSEIKESS